MVKRDPDKVRDFRKGLDVERPHKERVVCSWLSDIVDVLEQIPRQIQVSFNQLYKALGPYPKYVSCKSNKTTGDTFTGQDRYNGNQFDLWHTLQTYWNHMEQSSFGDSVVSPPDYSEIVILEKRAITTILENSQELEELAFAPPPILPYLLGRAIYETSINPKKRPYSQLLQIAQDHNNLSSLVEEVTSLYVGQTLVEY